MTMDYVLLLNQSFEVERSKLLIKIENVDIKLKPDSEDVKSQTNDSELLGRINVKTQTQEPEVIKYEREINVTEPKILRLNKKLMVKENILKFDKEILVSKPEITRIDRDLMVNLDDVIKFDKEVRASEPEVIRVDKEVTAEEPKIVRLNKKLMVKEKEIERFEREIDATEPEVIRLDKEVNTNDESYFGGLEKLSYSIEPETIIIKYDKELIEMDPEIIKLERSLSPVEYDIFKLYKDIIPTKGKSKLFDDNITIKRLDEFKTPNLVELMDEEMISGGSEENPLLVEYPEDRSSFEGTLSSLSSSEFMPNVMGVSNLSDEDPKSILTWNVSGLANTKSKRYVWDSFVQIIKQQDPDIVILQDVKLCSSQILGKTPRLSVRTHGGHVVPSYAQELQDANLVNDLKRTIFRRYYCVHSLSSWRVAGQIIFIKNGFKCLNQRFNLNIKTHARYHHPEGRCIILQFESFYLTSLLSPVQGWINRSVALSNKWDRELAIFLNNSKSEKASIITGSLNCAPEDIDLSDPEKLKQEKSVVLHEQGVIGYPGSRDVDREGFRWILDSGNLVDVFRFKHPFDGTPVKQKNLKFTTLAFLSDKTRCSVRTDLVLMTKSFLRNVKMCEIIGTDKDLDPSGWRHLPQLLKLQAK